MPETISYSVPAQSLSSTCIREGDIESDFIQKLCDLKYTYRPDIRDRASLERNFREKFEALNRVKLTDSEFARLLDDLVSPDVFKNSVRLREKNDFTRDDGTPLTYTLVNIKDWCKNDFEVIFQFRIKHVTRKAFAELEVPWISSDDQQRIETCLTLPNDLIAA